METKYRAALEAYVRALSVIDPLRLQFWDRRGLTMPQLRVMFLLREKELRSAGELAEVMHVHPATVTGLTTRLHRQGLIRRETDPSDRRLVLFDLTPEGRHVIEQISTAGMTYLDAIFGRMSAVAVQQFTKALAEFHAAAEEMQRESEGAI